MGNCIFINFTYNYNISTAQMYNYGLYMGCYKSLIPSNLYIDDANRFFDILYKFWR